VIGIEPPPTSCAVPVKVILALATGPVFVLKKPVAVQTPLGVSFKQPLSGCRAKVRAVGVGVGDGLVNPDEPELIMFDEVSVQRLPQSCCISWLFPLLEKSLVNL
jgi:hypothetical protein